MAIRMICRRSISPAEGPSATAIGPGELSGASPVWSSGVQNVLAFATVPGLSLHQIEGDRLSFLAFHQGILPFLKLRAKSPRKGKVRDGFQYHHLWWRS